MKKNINEERRGELKLKIVPGEPYALTYSVKGNAHIINPVDLTKIINQSSYLSQRGRQGRQAGHPSIIDVLEAAAEPVQKYASLTEAYSSPIFDVKDISPTDAWVKKNCTSKPPDDPSTPDYDENRAGCNFGHKSHVIGLDVDVSFLYLNGTEYSSTYVNKIDESIQTKAVIENLIFLNELASDKRVRQIFIHKRVFDAWVRRLSTTLSQFNELLKLEDEEQIPSLAGVEFDNFSLEDFKKSVLERKSYVQKLSSSLGSQKKITKDQSHWRHFHIRLNIPPEDSVKSSKYKKQKTKTLKKIESMKKRNISYTFGTVDGKILYSYNKDFRIHGASMQKLLALMVNLYLYRSNDAKRLTPNEMAFLMTYQTGSVSLSISKDRQNVKFPGTHSNHIMRYLWGSKPRPADNWKVYTGNRENEETRLPQITKEQYREWRKKLKLGNSTLSSMSIDDSDQSLKGNYQTTRDIFKILVILHNAANGSTSAAKLMSADPEDESLVQAAADDAEMIIALMNRDLDFFQEKFENIPDDFFSRGAFGKKKQFDREIFKMRESDSGSTISLRALTEKYLKEMGYNYKIKSFYGKGGYWKTINYGVVINDTYIYSFYGNRSAFGDDMNQKEYIAKILAQKIYTTEIMNNMQFEPEVDSEPPVPEDTSGDMTDSEGRPQE